MAVGVDSLKMENCDFSYNYRQRLKSTWEKEDLSDWMYYHDNENDEWLRYGAAVYLKQCNNAVVKSLKVTQGMNGLLLVECDKGLFYNNEIQFNSGLGIGMYRSSNNKVMHNKLDWNVRGYVHGRYSRGQDSAGILVYQECHKNTFAYNSATHSGDGFFLWAGNNYMETGKGGCNANLVYGNDFSYAPANGVEATFSSNRIYNNTMVGCRYGVWAGYSYQTEIISNMISECQVGIAFEHGQSNVIRHNEVSYSETGVQLWERDEQPKDWKFTENVDVSSKDYAIDHNMFIGTGNPLDISNSENIRIVLNQFSEFNEILTEKQPNNQIINRRNIIRQADKVDEIESSYTNTYAPEPLSDGENAMLPGSQLKGRQFILVNEWGPYDFKYPSMWLRTKEDNKYVFALFGPIGNWKLTKGEGMDRISLKSGVFPATLVVEKSEGDAPLNIELNFIGEAFRTQLGESIEKGAGFAFGYRE
jgi:parallel beta-helix repeat protein